VLLDREWVAENRRAIDLHGGGWHTPAFGAPKLHTLRSFLLHVTFTPGHCHPTMFEAMGPTIQSPSLDAHGVSAFSCRTRCTPVPIIDHHMETNNA
jgi:hypothetical protein